MDGIRYYYENHRTMEWIQIIVRRPPPLSFADLPTFLCVVVSWLWPKVKVKVRKESSLTFDLENLVTY